MPLSCSSAFKEWSPIVGALTSGRQTLLLRKGGIAEGPGGFRPEHDRFWLFPTAFHSEPGKLKPFAPPTLPPMHLPGTLLALAEVQETRWLDDRNVLTRLDSFHLWAPEELAKRWAFGKRPGLFVLLVRVFRLPNSHTIPDHPTYHGCKSWISLESAPSESGLEPVLDDATFATQRQKILQALAIPGASLKT